MCGEALENQASSAPQVAFAPVDYGNHASSGFTTPIGVVRHTTAPVVPVNPEPQAAVPAAAPEPAVPAAAPEPVACAPAPEPAASAPAPEPAASAAAPTAAAATSEAVEERLASIADKLADMQKALFELSGQFDDKISRNEHEAAVLKQVSAEVEEYRNGLYEKLTMPLIRDIIEVRTGIEAALARHGDAVPADEVGVFADMLADTLVKNSVEIVASAEGDEFITFKHKAVGKVPTDNPSLHGRIAAVEGESYRLDDRYIAPALVKVYTLEETAPAPADTPENASENAPETEAASDPAAE